MTVRGRLLTGLLVLLSGLGAVGVQGVDAAGLLVPTQVFTTPIATAEPAASGARGVAIQADGKAVVAGTSRCLASWCESASIARYGPDGVLDSSFGVNGIVTGQASGLSEANTVAIQPDGAILIGGVVAATGAPGEARGGKFAVARYLPNGGLDSSFGSGGVVRTEFCAEPAAGSVNDLAIQPDGRIVAAGSARCGENRVLAVARYLADGKPDPTFREGWVVFDQPRRAHEELRGVALQPDGKVVAVGGATGKFIAIRLTSSGRRDPSFGKRGFAEASVFAAATNPKVRPKRIYLKAVATSVAIAGRRILVAGGGNAAENSGMVMAFGSNGAFDRDFGRGGFVPMPRLLPLAIARDGCGRLDFAGIGARRKRQDAFAVASLRSDGKRQKQVRLITPFGSSARSTASSIALGSDGVLTAVGGVPSPSGEDFGLARFARPTGC
jgi:uncharacterized delta-60 repeat protein